MSFALDIPAAAGYHTGLFPIILRIVTVGSKFRLPVFLPEEFSLPASLPEEFRLSTSLPEEFRLPTFLPEEFRLPASLPEEFRLPAPPVSRPPRLLYRPMKEVDIRPERECKYKEKKRYHAN